MVGDRSPEVIGRPEDWLNTDGKALRLYGKDGILGADGICLVDFWESTLQRGIVSRVPRPRGSLPVPLRNRLASPSHTRSDLCASQQSFKECPR
jgi:hypothetical protein